MAIDLALDLQNRQVSGRNAAHIMINLRVSWAKQCEISEGSGSDQLNGCKPGGTAGRQQSKRTERALCDANVSATFFVR